MFNQLALYVQGIPGFPAPGAGPISPEAANCVLSQLRPSQLSEYLEGFWAANPRNLIKQAALGNALLGGVSGNPGMARPPAGIPALDPLFATPPGGAPVAIPAVPAGALWHHLVYAYLLENTRMFEIFRRVVSEWLHGERLPTARYASQQWLHTTEQLFLRDAWSYSVRAVTSSVRSDAGAVRRAAYYRLLGMDLNHGTDDGGAYAYFKPEQANRDFAMVFEALLAEVWRGYINRTTSVAPNVTDDSAIMNLVRRLREMAQARRIAGALAREEFDAVALASWLHLTVRLNTAVVEDLNAVADSAADRLQKIGERVGLPAHARSDAYFQLAEPMSNVLIAIEGNAVPNPNNWPANLYGGAYVADMLQIITHWSIATGRDVKDISTRPTAGAVLATAGARSALPAATQTGRALTLTR